MPRAAAERADAGEPADQVQEWFEDEPAGDPQAEEEGLSPKEKKRLEKARAKEARRKMKEQKKAAKKGAADDTFGQDDIVAAEEEAPAKGGKGRVVLMIILILLCIVFALELVGIGIKVFASTSPAAEFIDNILNSLIQMITGESDPGSGAV